MRVVNRSIADLCGRQRLPGTARQLSLSVRCVARTFPFPKNLQCQSPDEVPQHPTCTCKWHQHIWGHLNDVFTHSGGKKAKHTIKRMFSVSGYFHSQNTVHRKECPYYPGGHNQPASLVFSPTLTGFTVTSALTRAVGVNCPLWLSILERLCDKSELLNIKCASIFHLSKRDVWMSWHFKIMRYMRWRFWFSSLCPPLF